MINNRSGIGKELISNFFMTDGSKMGVNIVRWKYVCSKKFKATEARNFLLVFFMDLLLMGPRFRG
jgi:hypothetical protein